MSSYSKDSYSQGYIYLFTDNHGVIFDKRIIYIVLGIILLIYSLKYIIHPIHRLKLSDWSKQGHMTWINFDNFHVWKLIHVR